MEDVFDDPEWDALAASVVPAQFNAIPKTGKTEGHPCFDGERWAVMYVTDQGTGSVPHGVFSGAPVVDSATLYTSVHFQKGVVDDGNRFDVISRFYGDERLSAIIPHRHLQHTPIKFDGVVRDAQFLTMDHARQFAELSVAFQCNKVHLSAVLADLSRVSPPPSDNIGSYLKSITFDDLIHGFMFNIKRASAKSKFGWDNPVMSHDTELLSGLAKMHGAGVLRNDITFSANVLSVISAAADEHNVKPRAELTALAVAMHAEADRVPIEVLRAFVTSLLGKGMKVDVRSALKRLDEYLDIFNTLGSVELTSALFS